MVVVVAVIVVAVVVAVVAAVAVVAVVAVVTVVAVVAVAVAATTRVRPTNDNQKGVSVVTVNGCCCWLFTISFLIVCSTVDWLARPWSLQLFLFLPHQC